MPGINAARAEHESPVRVIITPSQSSFFAGEHFSVTVTFSNTRTPDVGPSTTTATTTTSPKPSVPARPQAYTHKRGAHSISSAPLARPPTSPGLTPRSAVTPIPRRVIGPADDGFPRRKGLVGTVRKAAPDGQFSELLEQRRKKLLAKSLSVSVSSQELEEQLGEGIVAASAPYSKQTFPDANQSPTSPHTSSPLARTNALSLSSNHPHARKQSLLDGRSPLDVLSPTTSIPPRPGTPPLASPPPNASLSLDTISESLLSGYPSSTTPSPTSPPGSSPLSPSYTQTITFPAAPAGSNTVQAYPSASAASQYQHQPQPHTQRFSQQMQLGLGQPPLGTANSSSSNNNKSRLQVPSPPYPRTAFSSTFAQTQTELILYSYAQLVGTVCVIPERGDKDQGVTIATATTTTAPSTTVEQRRTMNRVRGALMRKRVVVGGGSMDITHTQSLYAGGASVGTGPSLDSGGGGGGGGGGVPYPGHPRRRPAGAHGRSASFSAGLMSLLSTSTGGRDHTLVSSSSPSTSSLGGQLNGGQAPKSASGTRLGTLNGGGGGGAALDENIDPELPLPTFEAQPSMLAVDLFLFPGESRSYTYTIKLPDVLPPTFQGRALRFSYELVVGTCRAGSSGPKSNSGMSSVSRMMKVPIRVYNHVTVNRPPRPYDILWPVSHNRFLSFGKGREKEIPEAQGKVVEETGITVAKLKKTTHLSLAKSSVEGSLDELKQYTARLLASLPPVINEREGSSSLSSPASESDPVRRDVGLRMSLDDAREHEEEEDRALAGCREAVEILTRMPKKASYDVNKDGVRVAVLTFTKSAYRLGETVSGVVELNERTGRARVLQLSAVLEAHETLPKTVSSVRSLKRAYAEHCASFTLNTLRMAFALDIPSDASPAFQVRINDSEDPLPGCVGGLEWKVRLCLLVAVSTEDSDGGTEGVCLKSLERDGPRGEWGSSWRAPKKLAPMEKSRVFMKSEQTRSWTQLFVDSMWSVMVGDEYGGKGDGGSGGGGDDDDDERGYDGIKADAAGGVGRGVDYGGGDEGWRATRLETVECEVPIEVWPGNTAFRAVDVVFDV